MISNNHDDDVICLFLLTECVCVDVSEGAQREAEAVVRAGETHVAQHRGQQAVLILCVHAATHTQRHWLGNMQAN